MGEDGVGDALRDEHGDHDGDDLRDEHQARRDLHVVAELQAVEVVRRHLRRPAEVRLEQHERDGLAGRDVAAEQLREVVEREPLVRDGANDAEGDDEGDGEEDRHDKAPDGEASREDLDADAPSDEAEDEQQSVPPHRRLGVGHHEARVNIAHILPAGTEVPNDIATVPH